MVRRDAEVPNQNCGEVELFGQFASLARANGGEHRKQVGKLYRVVQIDIRWVARIKTPVRQNGQEVREANLAIAINIFGTPTPSAAGTGQANASHGDLNKGMFMKERPDPTGASIFDGQQQGPVVDGNVVGC